MPDIAESWEFCTIHSKSLNIAHGGRDDCERHVVVNTHLEIATVCA